MRRPIGWIEKMADGSKREIRVSFRADTLKWQFKPSDTNIWEYDIEPSEELWLILEDKLLELIQRGHLFDRELELVRRRGQRK